MPRFYCPCPLSIGAAVTLPQTVSHHIQVLRLTPGDIVTLFNGDGGQFLARLTFIEKKRVSAAIESFEPREVELPYALTLAQALPEGAKMDWIIEKAVELGAACIQPLQAQRSVVRLNPERAVKKAEHWHGIIVAASEQCGRNRLAQLGTLASMEEWIRQAPGTRILFSPRAPESLPAWAARQAPQAVSLLIGPEGGFTEAEEALALANGAQMLGLGTRVLRTETAGLAAIAALNALWE